MTFSKIEFKTSIMGVKFRQVEEAGEMGGRVRKEDSIVCVLYGEGLEMIAEMSP